MALARIQTNAGNCCEASLTRRWPDWRIRLRTRRSDAYQGKLRRVSVSYIDRRRFWSAVPIWLNVVTIAPAVVSRKNFPGSLAQFCNKVEVASPPVLT